MCKHNMTHDLIITKINNLLQDEQWNKWFVCEKTSDFPIFNFKNKRFVDERENGKI